VPDFPQGKRSVLVEIKARTLAFDGATVAGHETAPFHNPFGGFPDDVRIEDRCIWPGEAPGRGLEREAASWAHLR
jgi:hypothetical protein